MEPESTPLEMPMNTRCFRLRGKDWIVALLLSVSALPCASKAEMQNVPAHITYRIEEGVYVDIGSGSGLERGIKGSLLLEDGRSFTFEVMQAANSSALLRFGEQGVDLAAGNEILRVELVFDDAQQNSEETPVIPPAATTAAPEEPEPFVPLLERMNKMPALTQSKNVSHGNFGVRQSMQTGTDNQLDRMVTRLYTSGSIDRIEGTEWSLKWSGSARYRTGDAYVDHPDYQSLQPMIYNLMLQHPLEAGGFVRLGRFLPYELPGVGYIDGGQLEVSNGGLLRFGVLAGLKPGRVNLEVTADEPTVAGYTTLEAGKQGSSYYSGTAGLMASLYQGEANRFALLFDQRASLGPKLDVISTAQIDFGVANTTNSATQLSRFDLTASSRIARNHTLRAGMDHWERADTPSERDLLTIVDNSLFDSGYWRYWVGARHRLPLKLNLNEEVAYTVSDNTDAAMRWRVGLTRTGFFQWTSASISSTIYNLESQGNSGFGGLLSAYLPFWDSRLSVRPSASMRWLDPDNGGDGLTMSYYSVYLDARINRKWLLSGGLTQSIGDGADATSFDLGLRYSW